MRGRMGVSNVPFGDLSMSEEANDGSVTAFFLGFYRGGWSIVEVEIDVAMFVFRRWSCLGEFGFVFVVFFFLMWICIVISWIYWV